MHYLLKIVKRNVKPLLLLMLLYAVQALCSLFMPYVMSDIVEQGVRGQNLPYIFKAGGVMVALAVAALVCALLINSVNCRFSARVTVDIRREIFNKVNTLSFEQFSELGTGSLLTRTTDDVEWTEGVIGQIPYVIVCAPMMLFGGVILSFKGDWVLPLILLGVAAVVLAITTLITLRLEKYWQRGDEFTDVQNRILRERLSGIRVVRAFDKDGYEHNRTKHATSEMCNSFVTANTVSGLISPIAMLLLNIATVAAIWVGAVRLQSTNLTAGDVMASIQYIALIANAVMMLSWSISSIPHVRVSLRRIEAILNIPTAQDDVSQGRQLSGDVKFNGVNFAYGGAANSLSDVDFEASSGEVVGIIGGTGSGKSTLVKLLLDFYPTGSGTRQLGGVDYNELNAATVRDNMSVCLQKSTIFEGTIADNVRMGNPDATDEQVAEALAVAQMSGFVDGKEEGVNYKLMQSGSNLSGGQKQRVNIARALLKPASVYIFDDSFSALDYLTEVNLRRALNRYLAGKTQIVITQRAATAMRCDRVYVLEDGRVVGVGTHSQLMETCATYREIYYSQMGGDTNA